MNRQRQGGNPDAPVIHPFLCTEARWEEGGAGFYGFSGSEG